MTQNSGYDPSREPAGNRNPDPQYARNGHAHAGQDQRYPQGYQNGYDRGSYQQGGYDQQQYPDDQRGGYPQDAAYGQAYDQARRLPATTSPRTPATTTSRAATSRATTRRRTTSRRLRPATRTVPTPTPATSSRRATTRVTTAAGTSRAVTTSRRTTSRLRRLRPGRLRPAGLRDRRPHVHATLQLEDGSGRHFQLREGNNIIGRGQEAQFRLPDTGVSRRHIDIRWDGQVAMLSDLGSTNGTTVNGAPVQDWQLADGDIIRAGHSEILVRIL